MDEMPNLTEAFERVVKDNTIRMILLLIEECKSLEELKEKLKALLIK